MLIRIQVPVPPSTRDELVEWIRANTDPLQPTLPNTILSHLNFLNWELQYDVAFVRYAQGAYGPDPINNPAQPGRVDILMRPVNDKARLLTHLVLVTNLNRYATREYITDISPLSRVIVDPSSVMNPATT